MGLQYRKMSTIRELEMRVTAPLYPLSLSSFFQATPYRMASYSLGAPVVYNRKLFSFALSALPPMKDVRIHIAFAAERPLSADLIISRALKFQVPGGRYSYGYHTTAPISFSELQAYMDPIKDSPIVHTSGVYGKGFTPRAAASFITLSRLVRCYLESQPMPEMDEIFDTVIEEKNCIGTATISAALDDTALPNITGDGEVSIGEKWLTDLTINVGTEHDVVYKLKCPMQFISSQPGSVPEFTGHPIRFVPGSMPADQRFFGDLLYGPFSLVFNHLASKSKISVKTITDNLLQISRDAHGQELLHLMLTIHLALSCMGTCTAVMDDKGRLLGSILYTGQPIWVGDNLVSPVLDTNIRASVSDWMTSQAARGIIARKLSDRKMLKGEPAVPITAESIESHIQLATEISQRSRFSTVSGTFLSAIRLAGYDHVSLPASEENIALALRNIAARTIPNTFWVSDRLFLESDFVVTANLSIFGPSSVSFYNPGGKLVDIYFDKEDDPNAGKKKRIVHQEVVSGKKNRVKVATTEKEVFYWDRLCISRVGLEEAVKDFRTLRETCRITQVQTYDTKILGNLDVHPISGGSSELLMALRTFGGDERKFAKVKTREPFKEAGTVGVEAEDSDDGGVTI
jgi:hypothetical protein